MKITRRSVLIGAGAVALSAVVPGKEPPRLIRTSGITPVVFDPPEDAKRLLMMDDPDYEWRTSANWKNGRIVEYRVVRVAKHIGSFRTKLHIGDPVAKVRADG